MESILGCYDLDSLLLDYMDPNSRSYLARTNKFQLGVAKEDGVLDEWSALFAMISHPTVSIEEILPLAAKIGSQRIIEYGMQHGDIPQFGILTDRQLPDILRRCFEQACRSGHGRIVR